MNDENQDVAFLRYFLSQVVDDEEAIQLERRIDDLGVLITLRVAKGDMGRIIGKEGQTAKSLRILLRVIGAKNDERVNLKVLDPEGEENDTFEG